MPKLLMVLALVAGILLQHVMEVRADSDPSLAINRFQTDIEDDLRIHIAAISLGESEKATLNALPGGPRDWSGKPFAGGLPGEDFLSLSLVEKHLPGNTEMRLLPYAGAWAEPLAWDALDMGFTPGDQDGAKYAWNFGGGAIWFFRDVLGVDLGVRWTDRPIRLSRHGLRINDISTVAKADIVHMSAYLGVRMPLR